MSFQTPIKHQFAAATIDREGLSAEIDKAYELGPDGPRFCGQHYRGLATCQRIGNHPDEHVATSERGTLVHY